MLPERTPTNVHLRVICTCHGNKMPQRCLFPMQLHAMVSMVCCLLVTPARVPLAQIPEKLVQFYIPRPNRSGSDLAHGCPQICKRACTRVMLVGSMHIQWE